jgi:hypothetical protein
MRYGHDRLSDGRGDLLPLVVQGLFSAPHQKIFLLCRTFSRAFIQESDFPVMKTQVISEGVNFFLTGGISRRILAGAAITAVRRTTAGPQGINSSNPFSPLEVLS